MKARAGAGFDALVLATGLDEARLRQLARETLRIRAYVAQRFGTTAQVTEDEARKYYEEHPDEFTRDGVRMPFEEAEDEARQRASAERLRVDDRSVGSRSADESRGRDRRRNGSSVEGAHRIDSPAPPTATRKTSIELNPAWLTIGATLLRRRR